MSEKTPWLIIVGIGEDGRKGLDDASRKAIEDAKFVFGAPRHLALAEIGAEGIEFPVPFSVDPIIAKRGARVVVLTSGDPFWYGAGASLVKHLEADEWVARPAISTFSRAASHLGWSLESTHCRGLHAAAFEDIWPQLHDGTRWILLMRDGDAVAKFCAWLDERGFGASRVWVLEALGGVNERIRQSRASALDFDDIAHPVAIGLEAKGQGLAQSAGLADGVFESDGQMTKRPIRAMALSALAPREGECLWDLGAGSGTIAIEWLLGAPRTRSIAVEKRPDRARNIRSNAQKFGVARRMEIVENASLDVVDALADPDAIFIGGGANEALIARCWGRLGVHGRLLVHAVTIESEALLIHMQQRLGGELMRVEISRMEKLGSMHGWQAAYPLTLWSVVK